MPNRKLTTKEKLVFTILLILDKIEEVDSYFANPYKREEYRLSYGLAQQYLEKIFPSSPLHNSLKKEKEKGIRINTKKTELAISSSEFQKTYVAKKISLIAKKFKWDKYWRMVIFDIPEQNRSTRDFLRYHLRRLGFVPWQRSVWITIFPIEKEVSALLEKAALQNHAFILKAKSIPFSTNKKLFKNLFNSEKISYGYQQFVQKVKIELKNKKTNKNSIYQQFYQLISEDPGIPSKFLKPPNIREKSLALFKKLITSN
jgi:phenylacetic acid degradation operon negative regulatory protein